MMLSFFLNPGAFWWLLLLPIILALYFLKLKREECLIPSTLLWKKMIEDRRVNSLFARLKENLLLFFQLLLIVLLTFALARPFLSGKVEEKRKIVLSIDISASMGAMDEDKLSRLDKAKEIAEKLVDNMLEEDSMMLISFGRNAVIQHPFTSLKSLLKERIRSLKPMEEETRIQEALFLAQSMLQKVSLPFLYVITDGAIPDIESIKEEYQASSKKLNLTMPQFILVGKESSNVAILGFEVRRDSKNRHQGFARVQNLGNKPVQGYMEIQINGEVFLQEIKTVDLGPGDASAIFFDNLPVSEGKVEAHFIVTQGEDFLALDNKAYFSIQPKRIPTIALVTKGNFFLQKVLTIYESDLSILSLDTYQQQAKEFDIVIFDNHSPQQNLPSGGYLFIHAIPFLSGLENQGEIQETSGSLLTISDQNEFHPSMRFVDMRKLSIAKTMKIKWPEDTTPVLEAQNHILIGSFNRGKQDYMIISFDLMQSDWPLRLSFPIFMANTIEWFLEKQSQNNLKTGDMMELRLPKNTKEIQITNPQGSKSLLSILPDTIPVFPGTHYKGFYQIEAKDHPPQIRAVNFFSQQESNITPKNEIAFGDSTSIDTKDIASTKELWKILSFVAFFVLLAEWYLYHRRSFLGINAQALLLCLYEARLWA